MAYQKINFADVEAFEPLEDGEYAVEIEKVEVRRNKADDGNYLNWEMVVLDGDYENRRLWMITSLKDTALFRLKDVLGELDVLEEDELEEEFDLEYDDDVEVSTTSGPRLIYPEVEGLEATAVVKTEMYDGKPRNRVEALYGGGSRKTRRKSKTKSSGREERSNGRSRGGEKRRRVR